MGSETLGWLWCQFAHRWIWLWSVYAAHCDPTPYCPRCKRHR